MDLDITDWSLEDVTEGKRSFKLTSCTTGEVDEVYQLGELGHLNGKDLPSTAAGEELRVHWKVEGTDKSGDIPAAKLSSEIDRVDIAADALDELKEETYDGKTIVFTVRGNFSSAKISATLKVVPPEPLAVSEDGDVKVMTLGTLSNKTPCAMTGTNVGYDDAAENGIHEVRAAIDGTEYLWKSSKGGGFDASEVTLTFELQPGQEAPAPGSYDGIVAFERNGGTYGGEEIQSTRPVRVVID